MSTVKDSVQVQADEVAIWSGTSPVEPSFPCHALTSPHLDEQAVRPAVQKPRVVHVQARSSPADSSPPKHTVRASAPAWYAPAGRPITAQAGGAHGEAAQDCNPTPDPGRDAAHQAPSPGLRSSAPPRPDRAAPAGPLRFSRTTSIGPAADGRPAGGPAAAEQGRFSRAASFGPAAQSATQSSPAAGGSQRLSRATSLGPAAQDPAAGPTAAADARRQLDRATSDSPAVGLTGPKPGAGEGRVAEQVAAFNSAPASPMPAPRGPDAAATAPESTVAVAGRRAPRPPEGSILGSKNPAAIAGRRAPKGPEAAPDSGVGSYFGGGSESYFASSFD